MQPFLPAEKRCNTLRQAAFLLFRTLPAQIRGNDCFKQLL